MKYSEILGLQEYFHPVFNIESETGNYWQQFIPNDQFNAVLSKTLSAIETSDPRLRKSLWIQGTYGTGKSHASSVVKHLLWDDQNLIKDYIEDRLEEVCLKAKLNNFRSQKKILPVIIKGVGSITEHRTFSLQIERSVKQSLKKYDVDISTKSDFDRLMDKVENPFLDWAAIINKYTDLNILVSNKEDIINKLKASDIEFFRIIEDILNEEGIHFSHENITKWLVEVNDEIEKKGIANGIIIYWDEFTSLMDSINSGIINQIQNIAELSEKYNIFFYLISHRTPNVYSISKEDLNRMNDRFHIIQYRMEPITTYHIIAATIRKLDSKKWLKKQSETYSKSEKWDDLINYLTSNHSATAKSKIKDLFPIHPYSAFLSTFIARNLGSTNRSIFGFIYDKELGFQAFLEKDLNGEMLLTADYLWDFFVDAFENDEEARFNQVLDKYRLNIFRVQAKGEEFIKVFKGILLLNILFKVIEVTGEEGSPVTPSEENIISLFLGTKLENQIQEILSFIDERGIITKTPSGDFLIEFTSLPVREIEQAKEVIRNEFKDVISVLKYVQLDKELEKNIFKDNIYRESEIALLSASSDNEYILKNRINKAFYKSYTLRLAVFLPRDEFDLDAISKIKNIAIDEEFQNILFIFVEEPFGDRNFEKFIEYIARKQVSDNHRHEEQSANYANYATEQVREWLNRIKTRYMRLFFKGKEEKYLASKIGGVINKQYSQSIYTRGIDNISDLYRNANVWRFQTSKEAARIFINADDRAEIEEKTVGGGPNSYLKFLVKDNQGEYILKEDLSFKLDADENHPLKVITNIVEAKLNSLKESSQFNIGDELNFLADCPYGLYTNMPNMALLGFILQKYLGELYIADVGRPIDKEEMLDLLLNMFSYWQDKKNQNKLNVRFGSKEERELKEILLNLFDIKDHNSITDTRWAIINYAKTTAKFPLWALKYFKKDESLAIVVDEILKLIHHPTNELDVKLITNVLEKIKDYRVELKLYLKPENFRIGFQNFIKAIHESILAAESSFDEITNYLVANMQEEIGLWKEDSIKVKVLLWDKLKNQPPKPEDPTGGTPPTNPNEPIPPDPLPNPGKDQVILKITNFNQGEKVLKERIIKLIEDYPNLAAYFNRYFN